MKFPRFINRFLYRQGWVHETYQDRMTDPMGKLLSIHLAMAEIDEVSKITYGLPPGVTLTDEEKSNLEKEREDLFEAVADANPGFRETIRKLQRDREKSASKSVQFHRRDGLSEVPVWFFDGIWYRRPGVQAQIYPYFQQRIVDRLVTINGKTCDEQSTKWIEYTNLGEKRQRKYCEVDLVLEENGSFTIELIGTRVESPDAMVCVRPGRCS